MRKIFIKTRVTAKDTELWPRARNVQASVAYKSTRRHLHYDTLWCNSSNFAKYCVKRLIKFGSGGLKSTFERPRYLHLSTHRSATPLQVVTGAQHTSCLLPKRIQTDFFIINTHVQKIQYFSSQADSNFCKLLTEGANSRISSAYKKILVHTWDTYQLFVRHCNYSSILYSFWVIWRWMISWPWNLN